MNREEEARRAAGQGQPDPPECTLIHLSYGIHCEGGIKPLLDAVNNNDPIWCTHNFGYGGVCDEVVRYFDEQDAEGLAKTKIVLQLVLVVCGFIPVVGEGCDALDALIAYAEGDEEGALLSLLGMIPFAGWVAGGARGADLLRELKKFQRRADVCPTGFDRARAAGWCVPKAVLDQIREHYGDGVWQGVQYNIRRYNENAADHALNGVGTNVWALAAYLARERTFDYNDTRNPDVVIHYDEANKILVVKHRNGGQMIHAYNMDLATWRQMAGTRYTRR
jgi:hypothetical protein